MGVVARIRTETGETEESFDHVGISQVVVIARKRHLPFLSGVDYYGDTWFNAIQLPWVIPELETFLESAEPETSFAAAELIRLATTVVMGRPLRFLVFVGA